MMAVHVKFIGERSGPMPDRRADVALPAGATISDLLVALGIPTTENHIISRNSEVVKLNTPLRDGDNVQIYTIPPR